MKDAFTLDISGLNPEELLDNLKQGFQKFIMERKYPDAILPVMYGRKQMNPDEVHARINDWLQEINEPRWTKAFFELQMESAAANGWLAPVTVRYVSQAELYGKPGVEEGERCNRGGCVGIIDWIPEDPESPCNCHINPPCSRCTNVYLGCATCDWDSREVDEEEAGLKEFNARKEKLYARERGGAALRAYDEDNSFPWGMIPFVMQRNLGEFEEMYEGALSNLSLEDDEQRRALISAIWNLANDQFTAGQRFGEQDFRLVSECFSKAGIFSVNRFPEAGPEVHILKLIQEAKEGYHKPGDVEEFADMAIALFAAIFKSGFSLYQVMEAGVKKVDKVKDLEWLKLEDGTFQSVKPDKLSPSEAIYGFLSLLTVIPYETRLSSRHKPHQALDLLKLFMEKQGMDKPREDWVKAMKPCGADAIKLLEGKMTWWDRVKARWKNIKWEDIMDT